MNRHEAYEQYLRALKQGRKCHKDCVLHGRYPYPQVLDEILDSAAVAGQVELGIIEIPTEQITGTRTEGRRSAFAADFMPLMEPDSEFAQKWISLCAIHLSDEGIQDPIHCCEYLGRFYVQEGNKRVSVLKSYGAPTITGSVTRLIPVWSEDAEVLAYYDFMRSYRLTGLYRVSFSHAGSFDKLQAALGFEPGHVWTPEERQHFTAGLSYFQEAYRKLGGERLPITVADALLVWLKVYDFEELKAMSSAELVKSLSSIWADIKMLENASPISVSTEPPEPDEGGLLGRLFKPKAPERLDLAFINEYYPQQSDWIRAHDLGRQYLEAVMGERVTTQVFNGLHTAEAADAAIDRAVANGAQVIFSTTPPLIGACRRAAAKYPAVKFLNCSVFMPYTGVRTYYSRIYEAKFITGAIAGAMCPDGQIGYVASSPIFGVPAGINAFALGAQLTNPRARIRLRWSCVEKNAMELLARDGLTLISNRDVPTPDRTREPWGLCQVIDDGRFLSLASPYWHWGNFYVKLVHTILSGGWNATSSRQGAQVVNYWWGMRSKTIGVLLNDSLPAGVVQLVEALRSGLESGSILPFHRPIRSQDGVLRSDGSYWFPPEEILRMDWLCDCVDGSIPAFQELLPFSRTITRFQGVYRDSIPPEKEGVIL